MSGRYRRRLQCGFLNLAALFFDRGGLGDGFGSRADNLLKDLLGVRHPEGHIFHAIAVQRDMLRDRMVAVDRRGEDQPNVALLHNVGDPIADAGFWSGVGREREAKRAAIKVRGLLGVADVKLDIVDALQ